MAAGGDEHGTRAGVLPPGYDRRAAAEDRRALATLRSTEVPRRTRRRLAERVGDEAAVAARLDAWREHRYVPEGPRATLARARQDALALAEEYREVCRAVWGDAHPDVEANAQRIASGSVLPWDARHVIEAERDRARRLRGAR